MSGNLGKNSQNNVQDVRGMIGIKMEQELIECECGCKQIRKKYDKQNIIRKFMMGHNNKGRKFIRDKSITSRIEKMCRGCKRRRYEYEYTRLCKECHKEYIHIKKMEFQKYLQSLLENPIFYNLYGHIISDGCILINKCNRNISYCNKEVLLISEVHKELKYFFNKYVKIQKYANGVIYCTLYSLEVAKFFQKLKEENFLPKTQIQTSQFLRACFDDDGTIKNNGQISISQVKQEYIVNIYTLLLNLGIKSSRQNTPIKPSYKLKYNYTRYIFTLIISKKYNNIFLKKVGFTHPKKLRRLEDYINKVPYHKTYKNYVIGINDGIIINNINEIGGDVNA